MKKQQERYMRHKGRPSDNPLIAHVSCAAEVTPLVKYIPEAGKKLMDAFWPGPLTIIFPKVILYLMEPLVVLIQ